MDNPMKANTAYTAINLGCVVACVSGGCPAGMTCTGGQICTPN
jgi:hypothetical protein